MDIKGASNNTSTGTTNASTSTTGSTTSGPVQTPVEEDGFPAHFGQTQTQTQTKPTSKRVSAALRRGTSSSTSTSSNNRFGTTPSPRASSNWFSDSFSILPPSSSSSVSASASSPPPSLPPPLSSSPTSTLPSNQQQQQQQQLPLSTASQLQPHSSSTAATTAAVTPSASTSARTTTSTAPHSHPHSHTHSSSNTVTTTTASANLHVSDPTDPENIDSELNRVALAAATSTSFQATINSSNVMLGMGILTLPYALHISGWVFGLGMLTVFAFVAQFTAKLLAKCMQVPFPREGSSDTSSPSSGGISETTPLLNPHRHRTVHQDSNLARLPTSLSDIVELAFGPSSRPFISFLFMFELFAAATGLVILGADSIVALNPTLPLLPVKIAVTCLLVLTTFPRGMGWLAYGSIVGLLTLLSLFGILLFNGLVTPHTPGSLWDPAPTNLWPEETSAFGEVGSMWLAAGLFVIGLDAHAIFPSIYRDLKVPREFGRVVERAYVLNWGLYVGFASVGYIMFGKDILPQVTQNLPLIPTFNQSLTKFILFLTALNPFTKYALIMAPVNFQMEQILGIPNLSLPSRQLCTSLSGVFVRIFLGVAAILTTIMFPTFHVLIGLVGSLFSFMIAGVIPCVCYLRLGTGSGYRQERVVEGCRSSWGEMIVCILVVVAAVCLGLWVLLRVYSRNKLMLFFVCLFVE
ncbi:hypothetical protein BCR33DRAFT_682428 [Rhizoclosmatium globosum]|uniref:Amino acid transporter transmembrane domain-containing protein n=1 Tax=Rhizoclosmatium globosum TaxID=329046 RepID=A0A1Y2BUD0_9FUNG|nr:hypothetical protein BCR33DRAFT_682428 [Rhizoclosmatium globosum]|eukprot:ORY38359.1 hypothetical protein BCR33DRAFT_682428 [Rhizoclosmatium globosum]